MEQKMEEIKAIRLKIKNTFEHVTTKKNTVYEYYIKYIEKNKKNNFFGLDSFHFQNKLIELEYDNMTKLYNFIDNRMYCDYYKLFGLIIQFLKKNFKNDKYEILLKNNTYPIYKDLEQFKVYDFNVVNDIHHDIIVLINHSYDIVNRSNDEIKQDKQKLQNGLNIENYINNYIYTNNIIESNVKLFQNYLLSYHKYHAGFLNNLKEKLLLMSKQLDNDVQVENSEVSEVKVIEIEQVKVIEIVPVKVIEIVPVKVIENEKVEIVPVINEIIEPIEVEPFELIETTELDDIIEKVIDNVIEHVTNEVVEPINEVEPVTIEVIEPINEVIEPVTIEVEPVTNKVEPVTLSLIPAVKKNKKNKNKK